MRSPRLGYQRVPQTEEPGDFSVRGGIVDVFSPLYHNPMRIELEDDIVTSIRHFDPATQRSLGEVAEAMVIRTRCVPPMRAQGRAACATGWPCAAREIGLVRKEPAKLTDSLDNGLLFPGAELLTPLLLRRRARHRLRLPARNGARVAGRAGPRTRRGAAVSPSGSPRRPQPRRAKPIILSAAGGALPRRR